MTKGKKIELLYNIAKGNSVNISAAERKELRKYKIDAGGEYAFYSTKKNIVAYVEAIDNGSTRLAFWDWCMNKGYADKRREGSDKASIRKERQSYVLSWALGGSIMWLVCLGTVTGDLGSSVVPAILISTIVSLVSRKHVVFINSFLPLAIAIWYCVFK